MKYLLIAMIMSAPAFADIDLFVDGEKQDSKQRSYPRDNRPHCVAISSTRYSSHGDPTHRGTGRSFRRLG